MIEKYAYKELSWSMVEVIDKLNEVIEHVNKLEAGVYKEKEDAKEEEWPTYGVTYWFISFISAEGEVRSAIWQGDSIDKGFLDFGNCFRTREEAEAKRDEIKELLQGE